MADSPIPEIIPADSGGKRGGRNDKFDNLVDAISEIKQMSVMEMAGQEIPRDYFTLRSWLNFFQAGFGNGFIEGLAFGLLAAITLPLASDQVLSDYLSLYFPLVKSGIFLTTINCTPLLITVAICSHLSKTTRGNITGKAMDALLIGRSFCLIIKGILLYVAFILLHKILTVNVITRISTYFALANQGFSENVYRVLLSIKPHIIPTAYTTLWIFLSAMMTPFFTTWLVSFWRSSIRKTADTFWIEE